MSAPILKLSGVTKQVSPSFQLKNINLELYPNEVHVIIGENGSGKSCIMKLICGMMQPDSGEISIEGTPVEIPSLSASRKLGIIYVMQDPNLFEHMTVAENIFFYNMPYTNKLFKIIDYNKLNYECQKLFDELKLPLDVQAYIADIGLAQRQIIEFCKAYIANAKVVILDEPSATFTDYERDALYTLIGRIKERGAGILYISHKLSEIQSIGNRFSVVRHGEIIGTKVVDDTTDMQVIKMMSGLMYTTRYPKLDLKIGSEVLKIDNLCTAGNILTNISFSLHQYEIVGVTGLAGSGRSLLANCIYGSVPAESGQMYINNKLVHIKSPYDAIEHGIALVPENRLSDSIFGCLNVENNVSLASLKRFSKNFMLNTNFIDQVVSDYINKLNINSQGSHENIGLFSGGNQQKLILAKWIMSRSKIFILDEPTRGLDVSTRIDIYNSITDIVRKGASVLFISSDIEEILGMCDRVLVLSHGNIVCNLPRSSATKEKILSFATEKETDHS